MNYTEAKEILRKEMEEIAANDKWLWEDGKLNLSYQQGYLLSKAAFLLVEKTDLEKTIQD